MTRFDVIETKRLVLRRWREADREPAQVALPALLARFPRLSLAGAPVSRPGIALHGHVSLPVSAR